jgi:hypothetical protein
MSYENYDKKEGSMARVEGFEPARSEQEPVDSNGNPVPVGVWGDSSTGAGVFGTSGALPPNVANIPTNIAGVEGHSIQNPGVFGRSIENAGVTGESLQGLGVLGQSSSGSGVLGVTFVPVDPGGNPAASGVFGSSTVGGNGVVGFVGEATGVVGNSIRGTGVRGISTGNGVVGESVGDGARTGVLGSSDTGLGVQGESSSSDGILGRTFGAGAAFGVRGSHLSSSEDGGGVVGASFLGVGVHGLSFADFGVVGEGRHGVQGISTTPAGFAGDFLGNVRITGSLSKGGGGFEIDHPLDPANKYLCHSFVESPDMLNVYNGNVITDANGEASVTLPDYFEALNQDFRYQLTVIGQFAQAIVAQEISNNRFTIKTDQPRVKVSWQVTGIRQDPWAVANRIAVEEEKAAVEKGRYLHPELWGQPEEARIHRSPQREDHLRRLSQLVPEQLRQRVEQHLQALLRGDHVDREELQGLLVEARQLSESSRIDRARLEEEWRQVE